MTATLYAHLPGLRLESPSVPFADGQLIQLSFDDWMALESEFEYSADRYGKSAPVFWVGELDGDPASSAGNWSARVQDRLWPVHTALLLDIRAPLVPTPMLSCCYVRLPGVSAVVESATARLIGPMEREFIVYGSPLTHSYDAAALAAVEPWCRFLQTRDAATLDPEAVAGIGILEETARPDSWYRGDQELSRRHGFIRCMVAVEQLLLPPEDERNAGELTQTFGQHAAMLFGASRSDRDQTAGYFSSLYRLRTELIHGRAAFDENADDVVLRFHSGRQLLGHAVKAALLTPDANPARQPLWGRLRANWADPEHAAVMNPLLEPGFPA
jgi:hypothetical protein